MVDVGCSWPRGRLTIGGVKLVRADPTEAPEAWTGRVAIAAMSSKIMAKRTSVTYIECQWFSNLRGYKYQELQL